MFLTISYLNKGLNTLAFVKSIHWEAFQNWPVSSALHDLSGELDPVQRIILNSLKILLQFQDLWASQCRKRINSVPGNSNFTLNAIINWIILKHFIFLGLSFIIYTIRNIPKKKKKKILWLLSTVSSFLMLFQPKMQMALFRKI